jgi:hypothetical protein
VLTGTGTGIKKMHLVSRRKVPNPIYQVLIEMGLFNGYRYWYQYRNVPVLKKMHLVWRRKVPDPIYQVLIEMGLFNGYR